MAKLKVSGSASGTGTITLIAPATDTDRTVTLPDESITLAGGVDGIVSTADATTIVIDANENVGIGGVTLETDWKSNYTGVQIGGIGSVYSSTSVSSGGVLGLLNNCRRNGSSQYTRITAGYASRYRMYDGEHHFGLGTNVAADVEGTWTDALKITTDGRGVSQFTAKAWVNFNGTNTSDVRATHNVSSVTDVAVGRWKVNFTNSLASSSLCQVWMSGEGGSNSGSGTITNDGASTSYMAGSCRDHNNSNLDRPYITAIAFGA